jgi:hypothetical protein
MTGVNIHGGARPQVRQDDGRGKGKVGTPRPTAGRKPQAIRLKLDDRMMVSRKDKEGNAIIDDWNMPLWTVESATL